MSHKKFEKFFFPRYEEEYPKHMQIPSKFLCSGFPKNITLLDKTYNESAREIYKTTNLYLYDEDKNDTWCLFLCGNLYPHDYKTSPIYFYWKVWVKNDLAEWEEYDLDTRPSCFREVNKNGTYEFFLASYDTKTKKYTSSPDCYLRVTFNKGELINIPSPEELKNKKEYNNFDEMIAEILSKKN